jgi:carbamate kinase
LVTEAGAKQIDDMWAERARVQAVQKRAEINRQLHQAMQNGDLGAMSRCYHGLAIDNAEQGLPYFGLLKEAAKFELLSLKQSGVVSKVKISTTDSACKNCKKQNGKEYTIEQALLEMPLPNQSCTTDFADEKEGWCRCMYIAIVDEL